MISADKYNNALRALNTVLVCARKMAYDKRRHEDIAAVLDAAEELPTLFLQDEDLTDYFRGVLVMLSGKHPGLGLAVETFDGRA